MSDRVKVIYAEMLSRGPECWPFESKPEWLVRAAENGEVDFSTRGARDYAVINVQTPNGIEEAGPGDFIIRSRGHLSIEKALWR